MVDRNGRITGIKAMEFIVAVLGILVVVIAASIGGTWALVSASTESIDKNIKIYVESQMAINESLTHRIDTLDADTKEHDRSPGHAAIMEKFKATADRLDTIFESQKRLIENNHSGRSR